MLTLSICRLVHAQGTVNGTVFDDGHNELASIPVLLLQSSDSSIIRSALTNDAGYYRFEKIPKGDYYLQATMFGKGSTLKRVMIFNNDQLSINLFFNEAIQLEEVKVVSTGITVNGDTTTYIANRFTTGSERNLKDVLERLPNINIDENSKNITANGKHVNRVLLEGQDLFQSNTSIPLDNISADGVKKVEVIDNYSEYNVYEGFKTTNETVLNVGVDEKMKNSLKGEIEGYGGALNKYEARNSSLYIGNKSMFSGIIASNNTGRQLLSFQDIVQFGGGISNLLSGDNPVDELTSKMEMYSAFLNGRRDVARRDDSMASMNLIMNPYKNVKLSVNGIYGYEYDQSHKENMYNYLSGLEFSENAAELRSQHNGLLTIKLSYTPEKDFSVMYSGKMLLAVQDQSCENTIMEQNRIDFHSKPTTYYSQNNLLFAKKIGKNIINLSIDYSTIQYKERSSFLSSYPYYTASLSLGDSYDYQYNNLDNTFAAQIFYLHRISNKYYMRLSLKSEVDRQHFATHDCGDNLSLIFNNDSRINYFTYYGETMFGKDKGNLDFSLRLRYVFFHVNTDITKRFAKNNIGRISPMFQTKYRFTPYHYLMVNYEYNTQRNAINNFIDGQWVKSYNHIERSNADNYFSSCNKISLSHLLTLQYLGINLTNMATYEDIRNPIIENHYQVGYVSMIEKIQGKREQSYSLVSNAEYKLINIPLNVRCSASYNHAKTPMYFEGTLYNAASNNLMLMFQLITFYKNGFNGNIKWQTSNLSYTGIPTSNRLTTHDLVGQLTWKNSKIYASIDGRLRTFNSNLINTKNMYYGFELRYELNNKIMLRMNGTDVLHLKNRRQMTGTSTSYFTTNSLTNYMPGHIITGLTFKY